MAISSPHIIEIPASTVHLVQVRSQVGQLASRFGFSERDVQEIQLAVDEACTNVIKHAYKNDDSRSLNVVISGDSKTFSIAINHSGIPFDESKYHEPVIKDRIKQRKKGGVGVYLIKKLMDHVEYHSSENHNEILMLKRLQ